MKRDDDRRTEFGTGLRARLLRRRAQPRHPPPAPLRPGRPPSLRVRAPPAAVRVHVGLGKTELVRVERTPRFEVADVVPDWSHNARPGSSRNALTSRRNSAPVAP